MNIIPICEYYDFNKSFIHKYFSKHSFILYSNIGCGGEIKISYDCLFFRQGGFFLMKHIKRFKN